MKLAALFSCPTRVSKAGRTGATAIELWDGSYRHLYVDGAEVANDAAPLSGLGSAEGGLCFGAGSTLTPSVFFSGLIDEIRIHNRAVSP
jgi:hypothetical protein